MRRLMLLCGLVCLNSLSVLAKTEEVYRFERLWPVLQQPWYFDEIWDIAVSQQGYVYVVDVNHNQVQKLTLNGHLISYFGAFNDGLKPTQIAIDSEENLYVVYQHNSLFKIRKFNAYGVLLADEWTNESQCVEKLDNLAVDIAVDHQDNVYITCGRVNKLSSQGQLPEEGAVEPLTNHEVVGVLKKLSSQGQFLEEWPVEPLTDKDVVGVLKIAIGDNHIYVLDRSNHRVRKYTPKGELVKHWGDFGREAGQFDYPANIAIDSHNNLYVTDHLNDRIQKFTSEGKLIEQWHEGATITDCSEIADSLPFVIILIPNATNVGIDQPRTLIAVLKAEYSETVLLDDNCSIGNSLGNHILFIEKEELKHFPPFPNNDFQSTGIAVDSQDNVYVTHNFPYRLKKYTSEGILRSQWASHSQEEFNAPVKIARDQQGNLYVTDMLNHRISKFTADGQLITQWGELGKGEGQFFLPTGIAIDTAENIYVVDTGNTRIQKFTANGEFITQWQEFYYDPDFPGIPAIVSDIAVDTNQNVYVVDGGRKYINQFSSTGTLIKALGDSNDFQFPWSIAVDNHNQLIYVVDIDGSDVKKFTMAGELVPWTEKGLFQYPTDVATDEVGNVYVSDSESHRIHKLTTEGELLNQWGELGTNPGQFGEPSGLTVSPEGDRVYVVETVNNRIQVFNRSLHDVGKAIIVAGGTDKNDSLWNATQMVSNFAYRALVYQGFTKDRIYYLNANDKIDLDNNGVADDVDAKPTKEDLKYAITQWAKENDDFSDNLTIYMTDHGGDKTFQLSSTESLTAAELDEWLDTRQADMTGSIKIIYDACQSGSFLPHFVPPEGKNSIVITSAEADRNAYFSDDGSLSFSGHFWPNVLYGADIENAFRQSSTAVDYLQSTQTEQKQTPQLNSNGNNVANEPDDYAQVQKVWIGNGTFTPRGAPVIDSVSQAQTIRETNTATIKAEVSDDKGIARVRALVRKPSDLERVVAGDTITELPSFELQLVSENQYEGSYNGFDRAGSYELAIFAHDNDGNPSQPKTTTVFKETAFQRRAIIVGGHLPPAIQNIDQAYKALRYQGYREEEIYYLSNTSRPGVDVLTTFDNIEFALTMWAKENTQDLVIYLEGWGNDTLFRLNETETLPFSQLDSWLDTLQQNIPGVVTVIYEGPQSGHLISALTPPKDKTRIVISSTGTEERECANTESVEQLFSQHFWQTVLNGAKNIRDAFKIAKVNVKSLIDELHQDWSHEQEQGHLPQLDDNGNGIVGELDLDDGEIAKQHSIGIGIITAGTEPIINKVLVSPNPILIGDTTATLQVDNITTPDKINRVWAVITPPCQSSDATATTVELERERDNRYQGNYDGFRHEGRYQVAIYAEDTKGRRSLPQIIYIHQHWPLKPSQAVYQKGDKIQVRLPSPLVESEVQYLAVKLPDESLFVIKGLNDFVPFDAAAIPAAWAGSGEVAVDNIKVTSDLPKGEYRLYLVRIPKGTDLDLASESQILRESSFYVE
jgi:sugar lactone lactonase YvrE